MSERSKGIDTSTSRINNSPNPNLTASASRVVKNPLLSASVTGLSFDDFPNKPQLLPAAPPVVHAPPPPPVLMAGILNREPKSLVTVGQPTGIDDTENLDEINLNAISEDSSGFQRLPADANANPLLEPTPGLAGNDSLLSQAASSFTALPSVASNVFSTFSKRIYAGSKEAEEPQLDIQPNYIQQSVPPPAAVANPPFYAAPPSLAESEPPKFYAPTEVPGLNAPAPPTSVGNPNTYRLTARKKLYAPIPGLNEQTGGLQYPTQAAATGVEERKTAGGGLFSLTSLVPSGVLQNITGLVQSATGRNSDPVASNTSEGSYFDIQPSTGNYFGGSNTIPPAEGSYFAAQPPPPGGNYFVPGTVHPTVPTEGSYFTPATNPAVPSAQGVALPPPPAGNYLVPTAEPAFFNPAVPVAPPPVGNFFVPATVAPTPLSGFNPPRAAGNFFVPTSVAPPASTESAFLTPASEAVAPSPVTGFNPPPAAGNFFVPTSVALPASTESTFLTPASEAVAPTPLSGFNPPPAAGNHPVPTASAPPASTESAFFNPASEAAAPTPLSGFNLPPAAGNYLVPTTVTPPSSTESAFLTPASEAVAPSPVTGFNPPPAAGKYLVPTSVAPPPSTELAFLTPAKEAVAPTTLSGCNPPPAAGNYLVPTAVAPPASTKSAFLTPAKEAVAPTPPSGFIPPPAAGNFFVPTAVAPPASTESALLTPPSEAVAPSPIPGLNPPPAAGNFSIPTSVAPKASTESAFLTPASEAVAQTPLSGFNPPPAAGNFFVPSSVAPPASTESAFFNPAVPTSEAVAPPSARGTKPPPSVGNFFGPSSVAPPVIAADETVAPPPAGGIKPPPSVGNFVVPTSVDPAASTESAFLAVVPPPVTGFNPPPAAGNYLVPSLKPTDTTTGSAFFNPAEPTSTGVAPSPVKGFNPPPPVGNYFVPAAGASSAPPNATVTETRPPLSAGHLPPTGIAPPISQGGPPIAPPPIGQSSYRLQKGTRLYKSPLSAQETTSTASYVNPLPPVAAPNANIFNPFGQAATEVFNPLANPTVVKEDKQEQPQEASVPLFVASEKPTESQGIHFFAPTAPTVEAPALSAVPEASEIPTSKDTPEIPLFVPVPAETSPGLALYPPATEIPKASLNTQTKETFFNPFAQTITTPLVQPATEGLVAPPLGFVQPDNVDKPPPANSPLHSFFTPAAAAAAEDFNFLPALPPQHGIAPPPLAEEVTVPTSSSASLPLGFDNLRTPTPQQASSNLFSNSYQNSSINSYTAPTQPTPAAADSCSFFDQVSQPDLPTNNANEDQRIQNFFNNPPLQDQPAAPGELKYDIVHSGLAIRQERSQTPISNLVEPPSSACSEFSTVQRQVAAGEDLLQLHQAELPEEILKELRMASEKKQGSTPPIAIIYSPAVVHWFYKRSVGSKFVWTPFSHYDSALLETSLNCDDSTLIVPVEGGRYDVNIKERTKTPVYWESKAIEVRRCSWFYKGVDSKYVPYTEDTAALLEREYRLAAESGEWHQKIMLAGGEQVVFHGPTVIVHFLPQQNADSWGASTQNTMRPRVVKRDLDDFLIEQGESQRVDHLLLMVHGIGSACDLKMRTVEEVVDDFRNIAQQLVQSHYKNSTDMGLVGRVEVLPISWHGHLHSEELGIDEKLKSITLESIPRLRNFTNDTLLDVLFYTSPKYCQKIMNTVADSLNEVYLKYRSRHPEFNGGVSVAGHSLGSLILFDLLCHQESLKECEEENKENPDQLPLKQSATSNNNKQVQLPSNDLLSKQVSYAMAPAGTGQPVINYTQLIFQPKKFFALGSPIGMFVTIRGIDKLGLDFRLPTCPGFYNIFHPFDPVAYRIEALVNPDMNGIRPVLIPHHKGRKRMHLELKETMTRVGADIKQRFMDTFKTTLDSVNFLATVTKVKKEAEESLEKAVMQSSSHLYQQKQLEDQEEKSTASTSTKARQRTDSDSTTASDPDFVELDFPLGKINDSKRVDYVLQEAPLEFINEYIFALSSHVCYWGSEDTILFVMKEIYAGLGISSDSQVPQQSMTIERPSSRNGSFSQSLLPM